LKHIASDNRPTRSGDDSPPAKRFREVLISVFTFFGSTSILLLLIKAFWNVPFFKEMNILSRF